MDKQNQAHPRVKDRVLHALIALAGQTGCLQVTVTELIEKAGVARASFYRNFKRVDDVIDYGIEQMSRRYHEGKPSVQGFHSRQVMLYTFRFYREHADLILAFHRSQGATSLLDVILDCEIEASGDMPARSIARYELYYFAGAFYSMLLHWLESGANESPEAMADAFLRLSQADSAGPAASARRSLSGIEQ